MIKKILFLAFTLMLLSLDSSAQCAMCKAVAESSDSGLVDGLNDGILYLMAAPYLLLGSIGFAWYRYAKKKN